MKKYWVVREGVSGKLESYTRITEANVYVRIDPTILAQRITTPLLVEFNGSPLYFDDGKSKSWLVFDNGEYRIYSNNEFCRLFQKQLDVIVTNE